MLNFNIINIKMKDKPHSASEHEHDLSSKETGIERDYHLFKNVISSSKFDDFQAGRKDNNHQNQPGTYTYFNEDIESKVNQSLQPGIRRGFGKEMRKLIFILIFSISMLTNFDHGAIPAATTVLMEELHLNSMTLGIIGSILFLGLTFGASSAGFIFNNYTPKWIVTISIGCSCFFLYNFSQATTPVSLGIFRFLCGFFQVFCPIYFPVWVDQFGIFDNRTIWLSFLQLGSPVGTMLGYVLEAFCLRIFEDWKIAFYIQIFLLLVAMIILILTPDKFFSKNYKRTDLTRNLKNDFHDNVKNTSFYNKNFVINGPKYNRLSDFSIYSLKDEDQNLKETNIIEIVSLLMSNKIYTFVMLSICCLLFVVTGIQFWITDYMRIILQIEERTVYITFSIVCISAPTMGVILGGYLIENLGGYTDKRALDSCFKISIMAAVCGVPLPLVNNFPIFIILIWLLLFFGGSIVPGLTGIMLSSIPPNYKEVANSHTHFCYNLIGYLPAPFLYGFICRYTGGSESKWGLAFMMSVSLIGVFFLKYAIKHQKNIETELQDQNTTLFENYENQRKMTSIFRQNSLITAEALTTLYGRISHTQNTQLTQS